MIPPNDLQQRSDEIFSLFTVAKIDYGLKRLIDLARDFEDGESFKEVIVISATYHQLEKDERQGKITWEQAQVRREKLLYQALGVIDAIQRGLIH